MIEEYQIQYLRFLPGTLLKSLVPCLIGYINDNWELIRLLANFNRTEKYIFVAEKVHCNTYRTQSEKDLVFDKKEQAQILQHFAKYSTLVSIELILTYYNFFILV